MAHKPGHMHRQQPPLQVPTPRSRLETRTDSQKTI
jgi:hypothetical protein